MKTLNPVLLLFIVFVFVGCGRSDAPVAQPQQNLPAVDAAPKELSITEREALHAAKQRADRFYETLKRMQQKNTHPRIIIVDESIEKVTHNLNFAAWKADDLKYIVKNVDGQKDFVFADIDAMDTDYSYLLDVVPEFVREKTEVSQKKMKQDLKDLREFYRNKFADFEKHLPAINAEIAKRSGR